MYSRQRMPRSGFNRDPPVKVGEELDVAIEAVGEKGDGIAKKDGFVLFVKDTQQGEHCRVRVIKVLQKVGFAEKVGPAQSEPPTGSQEQQESAPMPEPEAEQSFEDSENFGSDLDESEGDGDSESDSSDEEQQ